MERQIPFFYGKHQTSFEVPSAAPIDQHVFRLIDQWNLPISIFPTLRKKVDEFFNENGQKAIDEESRLAIEPFLNGEVEIKDVIDKWLKLIEECKNFSQNQEKLTDEQIFSNSFQNIVHTGTNYEVLLQLEFRYMSEIAALIKKRDKEIQEIETKHNRSMNEVVTDVSNKFSDSFVQNLAQRQMEEKQLIEGRWNSDITMAKDRQKQEFKDFVMKMNEKILMSHSLSSSNLGKTNNKFSALGSHLTITFEIPEVPADQRRLETSYTVQLGAQLKSMYNLRLIRCDALDFCRVKASMKENQISFEPRRLQTLMSLYSNSLCGLVLLVPKRIRMTTSDIKEKFSSVCESSTDFHFPSFEQQISQIEECLQQANQVRSNNLDSQSINSKQSDGSSEDQNFCSLGDFYVTRHSNLSEVHVVYHLVTNDNALRSSTEMNSRHPVISGLRNILKECCKHDVTTLTIPLLLTHDMTEEMTIPWVLKRTELVLKCLKGFMIEMASWGTNRCSTIQLIVPENLLEQTFFQLADLVPTIFREPRTVNLQF